MQNILNRDLRQLVVGYLYAFFNQLFVPQVHGEEERNAELREVI